MPVYQAELYLEEAVESILAQSFDDFEIIALDDGSTDTSARILGALALRDDRVRVRRAKLVGVACQLNLGIAEARGVFIARMDADDVAHPERLERQLAYMKTHPECVVVGTGVHEVDPQRRIIRSPEISTSHEEIVERLFQGDGGALIHASALYRTDVLLSIGGYREKFPFGEVIDLHLRLAERGRLANLPDYLYEYRQNIDSVCFTRRLEIRRNQDAAIADALDRRGLDPESAPPRGPAIPNPSLHSVWAIWADHALVANYRETARHYALKAFRAAPRQHWKLPIRVWLGIQPGLWARWRNSMKRLLGQARPV